LIFPKNILREKQRLSCSSTQLKILLKNLKVWGYFKIFCFTKNSSDENI